MDAPLPVKRKLIVYQKLGTYYLESILGCSERHNGYPHARVRQIFIECAIASKTDLYRMRHRQ
jgi:hypothetical protein